MSTKPKPDIATLLSDGIAVPLPDGHTLSIRYDGIEIIAVTITSKRPESNEETLALLKELQAVLEATTVPDPEVLGRHSPNPNL